MQLNKEVSPDSNREVFFSVGDDRTAGIAVVNIKYTSKITKLLSNGQTVPDWSSSRYLIIGHYDTARGIWMLYPEAVHEHEKSNLEAMIEESAEMSHAMLLAEAEIGKPCVDLRHPSTVYARSVLSEILLETGIAERIVADNPIDDWGNTRTPDESTTFTFTLTPKLSGPGVGSERALSQQEKNDPSQYSINFNQSLSISYQGMLLDRQGGGRRANGNIHIATRSMDDSNIWIPNLDIVSIDEWDKIANVPHFILDFKNSYPNFSPEMCAIVHHYEH